MCVNKNKQGFFLKKKKDLRCDILLGTDRIALRINGLYISSYKKKSTDT
jgi:hypothetical protein